MAYTPTTWKDGDVITADLLNKLEKGVQNEQVGPQGPKGDPGAKGDTGAKGDPGVGLTGTAVVLAALANTADTEAVLAKVNEIVGILNARGVSKAK